MKERDQWANGCMLTGAGGGAAGEGKGWGLPEEVFRRNHGNCEI